MCHVSPLCLCESHILQSSFMSLVTHGSWQNGNSNHLRCNYKTNYRLPPLLLLLLPSPPYLSVILSQSSPTATVTPPIMRSHSCRRRLAFICALRASYTFFFFGLTAECATLTGGLHFAALGILCCVHVLMEIMCLPSQA